MTELPPWGSPPLEVSGAYEPPRHRPSTAFAIVVEQHKGSGQSMRWVAEPTWALPADASRDDAYAELERVARTLVPFHPISPQGRRVVRLSPDSYLVIVQGRTAEFHFRVSLGEIVQ